MADDIAQVQTSLDEIKSLLQNKKKEKGDAVSAEIFTNPRFIELFESYFKPLIESSKDIKGRLTEKKKISVFDVIGVSDREQDTKRDALTKELDKLTDKLHNIAKNLGNTKYYSISDIIGITKSERATNRRLVNNALRSLTASINQTAKNLSDPKALMKLTGLKQVTQSSKIEAPVVIKEKKKKTTAETGIATDAKRVDTPKASLAESEKARDNVVPVKLVAVGEEVAEMMSKMGRGTGPVVDDKGRGTGGDRESYSHNMNAIARNAVLATMLAGFSVSTLISGLLDNGPLKGTKKVTGRIGLKVMEKVGKSLLHFINNGVGSIMTSFGEELPKGGIAKVAGTFLKRGLLKLVGKKIYKFLAKFASKIPGIGLLVSAGYAISRIAQGDFMGGLMELGSGLLGQIPVIGWAASIGMDIYLAKRDLEGGGPKKLASKGINKKIGDFLAKWMGKLIYAALKYLPFGLGEKIAGWMGMDLAGLKSSTEDDGSVSGNPALDSAKDKIRNAMAVKDRANTQNNDITAKAIKEGRVKKTSNGIDDIQYTPEEQIIIKRNQETVERMKKLEDTTNADILNGTYNNKKAEPDAVKQGASAASEEAGKDGEASKDDTNEIPTVQANTPYIEQRATAIPIPSETVNELKRINTNLENMASKPNNQSTNTPGGSITNVVSAQGGGGGSILKYVLDTTRDTCYTSRERSRNLILDYRTVA